MLPCDIAILGVRARRQLNKDLLHKLGYCTDCGHENDRTHFKRTCSKCLRDAQKYYNTHKTARVAAMKAWAKANPEKYAQAHKSRALQLKSDAISAYGKICACCGESNLFFLCLDHVNGGGLKHRQELRARGSGQFYGYLKKHNYPSDPPLRVLCYNCNQGRQINGGICPHKESR